MISGPSCFIVISHVSFENREVSSVGNHARLQLSLSPVAKKITSP